MSQPASRKRNSLTLETIAAVWKYHLLAGMVCVALMLVSDLLDVSEAFCRLGWRLGPFSYLPYPYGVEPQAANSVGIMWVAVEIALGVVLGGAAMSLFCGLTHGAGLLAAVGIHARLGWPHYWRAVRTRIDLKGAWLASARRAWWAWPLAMSLTELLDGTATSLRWVWDWYSPSGSDHTVVTMLGACYIFGVVASRILRDEIVRAVDRDELICVACGYPLRGLPVLRCPECGRDATSSAVPEYGLLRRWPWRRTEARNVLPVLVASLWFMAPHAIPLGLAVVPNRWMELAPSWVQELRPYYGEHDPNALPVRVDNVCVAHRAGSVVVLRFIRSRPASADCLSLSWTDENGLYSGRPPDLRTCQRISYTYGKAGKAIPVGPWQFVVDFYEPVSILNRPDSSYSVEAFEPGHLPAYLRRLDEQGVWAAASASLPAASQGAGSAPSSRPQGNVVTASKPGE